MMKKCLFAAVVMLGALTGCVSMEYQGEKLPPKSSDAKIAVFTDSARISRPYQVLGTARVSGNYQEVSRDRMVEKLRTEARRVKTEKPFCAKTRFTVFQYVVIIAFGKFGYLFIDIVVDI